MAQQRPHLPSRIESELLFLNNHTCCVCRNSHKDVQVHHIDLDRSNNALENLAVLCLDCHSRATGSRGLGKAFSRAEMRRYKLAWERQIFESRKINRPMVKYQKEVISQVDLIVCSILGAKGNIRRQKELLDTMWELHLWRGTSELDRRIIQGLDHLALMASFDANPRVRRAR